MDQPTELKKPISKKAKTRSGRIWGYAVTAAIHILLIYIANNLIGWHAQLINQSWNEVLGILNFSFALNIIVYGSFIIYDKRLYYYIARMILDVVGVIVSYRLFVVFPFDFHGFFELGWLNDVFPILLWVGIVGLVIGMIARTVSLMSGKNIHY
ncbi:MAG: hypothetical protein WC734_04170 [Patescibacteria group bacterium]|jgi:hypothetical protein